MFEFKREWGLTRVEKRVFTLLVKHKLVSTEAVLSSLHSDHSSWPNQNVVKVHMSSIRRKMKPFGVVIETMYGEGWSLRDRSRFRVPAIPNDERRKAYNQGFVDAMDRAIRRFEDRIGALREELMQEIEDRRRQS